jgi:hypothetical protein
MKLSWRRPRLLLSAVVAAGALSGLTVAAAPAYAAGQHITVIGGPGEVLVQGGGFLGNATVRIEALTPDLSKVLDTIYVKANWIGYLDDYTYLNDFRGYTGKVLVAADGAPGPTAWASTQVSAAPGIIAKNTIDNHGWCDGVVTVWGYNFQPHATVRIELLSGDLATVMDTIYATIDQYGYLLYQLPPDQTPYSLNLTYGYDGPVAVVVDEYYPFNQTAWAGLYRAC